MPPLSQPPFLDVAFPVTVDKRLVDVIGDEVLQQDPSCSSVDFVQDIKSAKTPSGMDSLRLLALPVSPFFEIVSSEKTKKLIVVIDKPTPPSTVAPEPVKNIVGENHGQLEAKAQ